MFNFFQKKAEVLEHWISFAEEFQFSSAEFYAAARRLLTGIAVALCATCTFLLCACSQEADSAAGSFLKDKVKAQKGDARAQTSVGLAYQKGEGVAKDDVEAAKWYRKAAEQNYATAQVNLANCYKFGTGVEADYPEAYAWYALAANSGQLLADFSARLRKELVEEMSPQQIAAGEQRTRELQAQIQAKLKNGGK